MKKSVKRVLISISGRFKWDLNIVKIATNIELELFLLAMSNKVDMGQRMFSTVSYSTIWIRVFL